MTSGQFSNTYCLEFLIANQNCDGGWGFHPAAPSAVEATAWALAALLASGSASPAKARTAARDWLLKAQLADGSWPAFPGHQQGCWLTSVVALALHRQGGAQHAVERGLDWVLKAWPAEGTLWWRVRRALLPPRESRQDTSLRGWNWTPGTASWVEPTAHALLLLRALPLAMLSPAAAKRRELGERMLFDRMCPGGGWNNGNPLIYGVAGVTRIGPTAWALLALRDHADRPEIQMSLARFESSYAAIHGAASLALAHRCLVAYGRGAAGFAGAIEKLYSHNRFFENMLTLAWVALALEEEKAGQT